MNDKTKSKTSFFVKALLFVFVGFCVVTVISQQFEFNELSKEKTELQNKIEELRSEVEELHDDLARPVDDEYIKKVARLKLNYHLPEEIIFYNDLLK